MTRNGVRDFSFSSLASAFHWSRIFTASSLARGVSFSSVKAAREGGGVSADVSQPARNRGSMRAAVPRRMKYPLTDRLGCQENSARHDSESRFDGRDALFQSLGLRRDRALDE